MGRKVKNNSGELIGNLTLIDYYKEELSSGRSVVKWKCKCSCGELTEVLASNLQRGKTLSCGCNNRLKEGEGSLRVLFRSYKTSSLKRGLEFDLTEDYFKIITKQNCYYCGVEPYQTIENSNGRGNGVYIYNGIDRLNNLKGYSESNTIPCCKVCNYAKRDMPYDNFMEWIDRLIENNKSKIV